MVLTLAFGGYAIHTTLNTLEEIPAQPGGSFSNPLGSVLRFLLPDSSQVWLSTGSTLSCAENFPQNRKVSLEGEAFFEVEPNPEAPFEIQTDLSVYTGKVQFGHAGKSGETFILTQNQGISWSSEEGFSVIQNFDVTQGPDWKSGVFYFENSSLEEVVQTLHRWYLVDFEIKGKEGTCRYSGEFHPSSLEQVLEIMSYTLNLNYQLYNEKVELKPKNYE